MSDVSHHFNIGLPYSSQALSGFHRRQTQDIYRESDSIPIISNSSYTMGGAKMSKIYLIYTTKSRGFLPNCRV